MSELRWNPLLEEWVITATERQERTFLPPKDFCPLCPTKPGGFPTEVEEPTFEIVVFENKFPSLRRNPPAPAVQGTDLYPVRPAQGICEVVVYTPRHEGTLTNSPLEEIENLVHVWADRSADLGARPEIEYVFIMENKGEVIGVTLHHPHGQVYAFPYIPPKVQRELDAAARHHATTGRSLVLDVVQAELEDGRRIVAANEHWLAGVPFFARYPYEVHLWARAPRQWIHQTTDEERRALAEVLKTVLLKYDNLWGFSMPYVMVMHQAPSDGGDYPGYGLHLEFYPPYRTKEKLKFLAGVESGAGSFINDTLAEERAAALRAAAPVTDETGRLA